MRAARPLPCSARAEEPRDGAACDAVTCVVVDRRPAALRARQRRQEAMLVVMGRRRRHVDVAEPVQPARGPASRPRGFAVYSGLNGG